MWGEYVPVHQRIENAKRKLEKMRKKGLVIEPVSLDGKKIAREFWGIKWCEHLESFADYSNRLPRGRTYVRNGSVCHLNIEKGCCRAYVAGSSLYTVTVRIKELCLDRWQQIKARCSGKIGSMLELLQGKLSSHVMEVVADHTEGLFPLRKEIEYACSCPDWAGMCKHVASVLYAIGSRLDIRPELLFVLRGVDAEELITTDISLEAQDTEDQLDATDLGALFGIEIDEKVQNINKTQDEPKQGKSKQGKSKQGKSKQGKSKQGKSGKTRQKPVKQETAKKQRLDYNNLTGKMLRAHRKKLNCSVAEFAKHLQVSVATVYRWENTQGRLLLRERYKKKLQAHVY